MSVESVATSHIESWTSEEVSAFLSGLGLSQYEDDFAENGITGDILVHLDHESLKDIGVVSVGHRLVVLRKIYEHKIADGVQIDPEHFIPATAAGGDDGLPTLAELSRDVLTITSAIQQRDERMASYDVGMQQMDQRLTRLEDQNIITSKSTKEFQALPTPDASSPANALPRKFSTKKLFLGNAPRQTSPTHPPAQYFYGEPESPRSPSKPAESPSTRSQPSASMSGATYLELAPPRLPPPPRPPPPGSYNTSPVHSLASSNRRAEEKAAAASAAAMDAFKSFRVGLDDPCSKVLPAALKKYKINSDWREYSLFICYQDQERCLALDEKPLLVFQELQRANKSPVFMLRKQNGHELDQPKK